MFFAELKYYIVHMGKTGLIIFCTYFLNALHWYESFLTHSLPPIHFLIACVHEGTIWRIAPIRSSRSVESVCIQMQLFWITNHTTCAFTRALFGVCKYLSLRVYACERRANIYMRARILCFGVSVCVCVCIDEVIPSWICALAWTII